MPPLSCSKVDNFWENTLPPTGQTSAPEPSLGMHYKAWKTYLPFQLKNRIGVWANDCSFSLLLDDVPILDSLGLT